MGPNSASFRQSPLKRFVFGAIIGIAISIPIFLSIDDLPIRILFMSLCGGIVGIGQVLAGSPSPKARRAMLWLTGLGVLTFLAGIGAFFAVN